MNRTIGIRRNKLFKYRVTVMLEDEPFGFFSYAQMINFSGGGICFGSDVALKRGVNKNIRLHKPIFKAATKTYHAIVRWFKELSDSNFVFPSGIVVEYC
jgi:hypothetical protein